EHEFLRREAARGERTMASVIRSYIDEKMEISEEAWTNNPMLRPTPRDGAGESREDAGINLDHYLYGCPKDWIKVNGKFAEAPPLPEDYYSNPARQKAYDKMIEKLDESQ
ncbi:MAG: hypothetical protein KGR98_08785, partial [Verrucomicrobia bacterium]|nr:hypothetical protein [Verrucomicrobiota bacterium]